MERQVSIVRFLDDTYRLYVSTPTGRKWYMLNSLMSTSHIICGPDSPDTYHRDPIRDILTHTISLGDGGTYQDAMKSYDVAHEVVFIDDIKRQLWVYTKSDKMWRKER